MASRQPPPTVAILLGGRILTPSVERSIIEMRGVLDALAAADLDRVSIFVSVNENGVTPSEAKESAHDEAYMDRFCTALGINRERQTSVSVTLTPPRVFQVEKHPLVNATKCWSMFVHNHRAFALMEAEEERIGRRFDVVIKYRADLFETAPRQYPLLAEAARAALQDGWSDVHDHAWCTPGDGAAARPTPRVHIPYGYDNGGINDQIAIGTRAVMAEYCACTQEFLSMCEQGVLLHPETLLHQHLIRRGIRAARFAFSFAIRR